MPSLATMIICAILVLLFGLAIYRIRRKGSCDCSSCSGSATCPGSKMNNQSSMNDGNGPDAAGCSQCSSCQCVLTAEELHKS